MICFLHPHYRLGYQKTKQKKNQQKNQKREETPVQAVPLAKADILVNQETGSSNTCACIYIFIHIPAIYECLALYLHPFLIMVIAYPKQQKQRNATAHRSSSDVVNPYKHFSNEALCCLGQRFGARVFNLGFFHCACTLLRSVLFKGRR